MSPPNHFQINAGSGGNGGSATTDGSGPAIGGDGGNGGNVDLDQSKRTDTVDQSHRSNQFFWISSAVLMVCILAATMLLMTGIVSIEDVREIVEDVTQ